LTGGLPEVGIRIPKSDITLRLVELLGVPITATSANASGNTPPVSAEEAASQIKEADIVISFPQIGYCKVYNLSVDPKTKKLIVEYEDEPIKREG